MVDEFQEQKSIQTSPKEKYRDRHPNEFNQIQGKSMQKS
jgi:hypothetical protein